MTRWRLIWRSMRYFAAVQVPVILAAAVCTAVITGALLVGDSVRGSLLRLVRLRLGDAVVAVTSGDRLPAADLAERLGRELNLPATAMLRLSGVATVPGTDLRLNQVRINGVDRRFANFFPAEPMPLPSADGVVVSETVAKRLDLEIGDTMLLRMEKVTALPRGTPLAASERMASMRLAVEAIVDEAQFGRFSLRAEHLPPANVFVSLEALCEALEIDSKANTVLLGDDRALSAGEVEEALSTVWRLADAGLVVESLPEMGCDVSSNRVFLADTVARQAGSGRRSSTFLSYFVTSIRTDSADTPYSFVAGTDAEWLDDLGADGMAVTQWLADDLACNVGDAITLEYMVLGPMGTLQTRQASFTVETILPMESPFADPSLMPEIPGLADAGSCIEWRPGIPIDLDRIRDKDEAYWDRWKGAPKGFVSLAAARRLWANEFGNATSVRLPEAADPEAVATELRQTLSPLQLGFQVTPVLAQGLQAGTQSVDFAQLFLGLSFFLIAAALTLMGLLFALAVERRREQVGTLMAFGFTPAQVRRLYYAEGACLTVPAVILGLLAGLAYNSLVLKALTTLWEGTVGDVTLVPHVTWVSLLVGAVAGTAGAMLVVWVVMRRLTASTVEHLHSGATLSLRRVRTRIWTLLAGAIAVAVAVWLVLRGDPERGRDAAATFFSAGSLMLIGGMAMLDGVLGGLLRWRVGGLSLRNAVRRRSRSLAVAGVLACAVFLVVAVGANRHGPANGATGPSSGTGGFDFYVETSIPVMADLNTEEGREDVGLRAEAFDRLTVMQMSLSEGDDASCLNLNRSARPRILGVPVNDLAQRGAFSFVKTAPAVDADDPWQSLRLDLGENEVPVVADQTVIVWGLGLDVGETLTLEDGRGEPVTLRFVGGIANSVLQGNVLMSEEQFRTHFPGEGGARVMLADVPDDARQEAARVLPATLSDYGLVLTPCVERLAQFHTVENTYLAIFLALGGLGLLLGSAGLAAVVIRNVMERRSELALLRAVGFGRVRIGVMVTLEHLALLCAGLLVGTVSGLVAVLPAIAGPQGNPDLLSVAGWCVAVFIAGTLWIVLAAFTVTRGNLVEALRNE